MSVSRLGDGTVARTGAPVRATVCAGGVETDYDRAGTGAVLLLLTAPNDTDRETLLRQYARQSRVIAPRVPVGVEFASWMRDFLDGVGVIGASIVVTRELLAPALEFAQSDPARVQRVSLVGAGATHHS